MAQPWFIWNGVDSRTMGVIVESYPPMVYPAERAEAIAVPGRSGYLLRTEGRHIYDGYLKTIGIANKRSADPQAIAAWLRGSGELILGSEPGFVYYGRVLKETALDRAMPNGYHGSVSFMVQPEKGQMPPEGVVSWSNGTTSPRLFNPGDVPAKPVVTMSGTISNPERGLMFELYVCDEATFGTSSAPYVMINMMDRPDLTGCIYDADTRRITTLDGAEILDNYATYFHAENGELFLPEKQISVVALDTTNATASSMTIRPRWRWL